jgi:hypothetical protein
MRQLLKTKLVGYGLICKSIKMFESGQVDTLGDLDRINKMTYEIP